MIRNLKTSLAALAITTGVLSLGATNAHAININILCSNSLTATWTQAAAGRTNTVNKSSSRIVAPGEPPTKVLACIMDGLTATDKITQVVTFPANTPASACKATATFAGRAPTRGGVPPFAGFIFRSVVINAIPTYTAATGRCQLDIFLRPLATVTSVSQNCTPFAINAWACPGTVQPTSN